MLPNGVRALAVRVRPATYETLSSYECRLREANGYTERAWNIIVNDALRSGVDVPRDRVIEAFAELRTGHFDWTAPGDLAHSNADQCAHCVWSLAERYACVLCTHGQQARQRPHDGPRVCARHMRWVGPGVAPEDQVTVDREVLRADREYRRLRRAGHTDATRLSEIVACISAWALASNHLMDTAQQFCTAIAITRGLLRTGIFTTQAMTSSQRRAHVDSVCATVVHDTNVNVLADAVILLLRADRHAGPRAHAFIDVEAPDAVHETDEVAALTSSFFPEFVTSS